jgi:TM2 domain-containing membrane protein YozV
LAFFFGGLGVHWYYLEKKNKAFTYLGMWIGGVVLAVIIIGLIPLIIVGILALIDTIKLLMMDDEDFDMQYNT